jgi:hypothetical protein
LHLRSHQKQIHQRSILTERSAVIIRVNLWNRKEGPGQAIINKTQNLGMLKERKIKAVVKSICRARKAKKYQYFIGEFCALKHHVSTLYCVFESFSCEKFIFSPKVDSRFKLEAAGRQAGT